MKRTLLGILVWGAVSFGVTWDYQGSFTKAFVSDPACDFIFDLSPYKVRVVRLTPDHYTAVIYFADSAGTGFLHNRSMAGAIGPSEDIFADKHFPHGKFRVEMTAKGIFDPEVLSLQMEATLRPLGGGDAACTAQTDFTGFPD